jgi:hypothetical protein
MYSAVGRASQKCWVDHSRKRSRVRDIDSHRSHSSCSNRLSVFVEEDAPTHLFHFVAFVIWRRAEPGQCGKCTKGSSNVPCIQGNVCSNKTMAKYHQRKKIVTFVSFFPVLTGDLPLHLCLQLQYCFKFSSLLCSWPAKQLTTDLA